MAGNNKQELIRSKRIINETFDEPRSFSAVDWRDHLALSEKLGALETKLSERMSSVEARVGSLELQSTQRSTAKLTIYAAVIGFMGAIIGAGIGPYATELLK